MSRVVPFSVWLCILPLVGACVLEEIKGKSETICGTVAAGGPIERADVEIYQLDPVTGGILSLEPVDWTTTPTDENGRFCMHDTTISGMVLFLARGGEINEFWSTESMPLRHAHLSALITDWSGQENVTITPWTTLVEQLANGRYAGAEEPTFFHAMISANEILYEHFIGSIPSVLDHSDCMNRLDCIEIDFDAGTDTSQSLEAKRYVSTLLSLSALALDWFNSNSADFAIDSVELTTEYLLKDATDGRFDGFSYEQALITTTDTLRSDMVMSLMSAESNGLLPPLSSRTSFFQHIAMNNDPRLFPTR